MDSTTSEGQDSTMQDSDIERIDLLMELLDDPSANSAEDERLDFVIRSLEAEIRSDPDLLVIGDGESTTGPNDMDSDDQGLDEINFDFDKFDGSSRNNFMYDAVDNHDMYGWPEMVAVEGAEAAGERPASHEMRMWYVMGEGIECGFVGVGEQREYNYSSDSYGGESCMEQAYSPLWE